MINGKATQLPADVVVQMLDGMSASECWPDRDHHHTIFQIRCRRKRRRYSHHHQRKSGVRNECRRPAYCKDIEWAETLGANFSINRRTEKLALYADYSFVKTRNLHTMDLERHTSADYSVVNHSHRKNITDQHNLNIGAEWQLTKNISVDLLITGYSRRWRLNAITNDLSRVSADSLL